MLKKVLKYDLSSIFKYWWIGAAACLALSVLGTFGLNFINSEKEIPVAIEIFSTISLILTVLGYTAFLFLAEILLLVRYYKNFYSDEGYLTFTLPVKRLTLFNSKLITAGITSISSFMFCCICGGAMLLIGFRRQIFTKETYEMLMLNWNEFKNMFNNPTDIALFTLFILEIIIICFVSLIASTLFIYLCISIGATISKKAKVASAIGIYYLATSTLSFIISMFTIFVSSAVSNWMFNLPESETDVVLILMLLIVILFILMICAGLYALHYKLLDKKLNLS